MRAVECCRILEGNNHGNHNLPLMQLESKHAQPQENSPMHLLEMKSEFHQPEMSSVLESEAHPAELGSVLENSTVVNVQPAEMQLEMAAALFLLTLKEKYKVNALLIISHAKTLALLFQQISQSAVDYVVEGIANLIQWSVAEHEVAFVCSVQPHVHPSVAEQVKCSISQQRSAPFAKLFSANLQAKFVEEKFPYVVSIHIHTYILVMYHISSTKSLIQIKACLDYNPGILSSYIK